MPKPLVIVESPAKARTIAGFLGGDYVVRASMGHIRDLPAKGLQVDVDNGFKVDYEVHASKKEVIRELKAALKDADELYLATDEDREGEAISWHLLEVLKPRVPVRRMVFHEITRTAIEHAVENSRDIDYGLVDAQESRRIVDRLFGYPVSEVCWRKISQGLSAGRVQSPAVRLVVERERERMAFRAAVLLGPHRRLPDRARLRGPARRPSTAPRSPRAATSTPSAQPKRADVARARRGRRPRPAPSASTASRSPSAPSRRSRTRRSPKPPFITSTLQQVGGSRLRMSAQQVMRVAQGLYERGYITYMRTDSTTLSDTARDAPPARPSRSASAASTSPTAPAPTPRRRRTPRRPTRRSAPPATRSGRPSRCAASCSGDDLRLYELIWQRTLASQMPDARGLDGDRPAARRTTDGRRVDRVDGVGPHDHVPGLARRLRLRRRRRRGARRAGRQAARARRGGVAARSRPSRPPATAPSRRPATPRRRS